MRRRWPGAAISRPEHPPRGRIRNRGMATEIWFENPAVGQRFRLVVAPGETGGRRFVLDYITQPFAGQHAVPAHVHTTYVETFEILKGRARYQLGAETKTATAGE